MRNAPPRWWLLAGTAVAAAVTGLTVGLVGPRLVAPALPTLPSLPPLSSSASVVRPTPDVIVAVKSLARLETAAFHMERVIDLREKQSQLFGLLASEDAILLVAVADVTAGVDLRRLSPDDIEVASDGRRVRITLPASEIFHAALDPEKTYVHTRRTDLLARRNETLESNARKEAERALTQAALDGGILEKADQSAHRIVRELLASLGFQHIEIATRPPGRGE
ncbi:MAG TPA: DUF4230 domain-containing protein [Polyangiaceae bacterium]|nr:DUF4230 domain-containing protein [Polyangiaceae bacterium]